MKNNKLLKEKRDESIISIHKLKKTISKLSIEIDNTSESDKPLQLQLIKKYEQTLDKLQQAQDEYIDCLPKRAVSKSPLSKKQIYIATIDTFGLDGSWWNAEQPIRVKDDETSNIFALTGSININGDIPKIPFPIKPGPAVPWVCPRLLEDDRIIAVISHLKVGNYDAYITVYYTNDDSIEIERINTWGSDYYIAEDKDGYALFGNTFDTPEEYDFNIAPWIKKGKVKWIDIEDKSFTLQDTIEECPYLNLNGYRYPVLIRNKTVTNCMIELEYIENENNEENFEFCTNCGKPLPKGAKFCPYCGAKVLDFKGDEL